MAYERLEQRQLLTTVNQIVHHWNLDEGPDWHDDSFQADSQSTVAADVVGGADAVLTNMDGSAWVAGRQFTGLEFDGQDDYLAIGSDLSPTLGDTASLAFWIRTTQIGANVGADSPGITGVERTADVNDIQWGWIDSVGRLNLSVGDAIIARSAEAVNDGQWHHIALTRDASTGRGEVYVDGVLSDSQMGPQGAVTTPFSSLGRVEDTDGEPRYFQGRIDQVYAFNRVVDATTLKQIKDNHAPRTYDNETTVVRPVVGTNVTPFVTHSVLLAYTYDPEQDTLSVVSFNQPAHGSVIHNGDGSFTYTANANFAGEDSFRVVIGDDRGGFSTTTVTVRVLDGEAATLSGTPAFTDFHTIQADGADVDMNGWSVPRAVDWDADGDRDLLIGGSGSIWLYTNISAVSTPTFSAGVRIQADGTDINIGSGVVSFTLADLTGDGADDLIATTNDNTLLLYANTAGAGQTPVYAAPITIQTPDGNDLVLGDRRFDIGDFNDDGLLDVVQGTWGSGLWYRLNVGTASHPIFERGTKSTDEKYHLYPRVVDLNADGLPDLVRGINWGDVKYWLNDGGDNITDGATSFRFIVTDSTGATVDLRPYTDGPIVDLADMNGDGLMDLLVGAHGRGKVHLAYGKNPLENIDAIEAIYDAGLPDVGGALSANDDALFHEVNALNSDFVRWSVFFTSPAERRMAFDRLVQHVNKYPQFLKHQNLDTDRYHHLPSIAAQNWITLHQLGPDNEDHRREVADAMGLSGLWRDIYLESGLVIGDNATATTGQLLSVQAFMKHHPRVLYPDTLLMFDHFDSDGSEGIVYGFTSSKNVFNWDVGQVESGWPSDLAEPIVQAFGVPTFTDSFTLVLAHEATHSLDRYVRSRANQDLQRRWGQMLVQAGGPDVIAGANGWVDWNLTQQHWQTEGYWDSALQTWGEAYAAYWSNGPGSDWESASFMRGNIDWFLNTSQESLATQANQQWADSEGRLVAAIDRYYRGMQSGIEPLKANISEVLFFLDLQSAGLNKVEMFDIDVQLHPERRAIWDITEALLERDDNGRITKVTVDDRVYEFAVDNQGKVTDILRTPLYALDDEQVTMDSPVEILPTANDFDLAGDPITLLSHSAPANGSVIKTQQGTLIYTPNAGFSGVDTFTYTASSSTGEIGSGTIYVMVKRGVLEETWYNVNGSSLTDLRNTPDFPDNPDETYYVGRFEARTNHSDNYGTRMRAYVQAPADGEYTFWISSDNQGELWLSTDDDPADAALIANVPDWVKPQKWTKYAEQRSDPVSLQGGQLYYIEALVKESTGGDNLAVAWAGPAIPGPKAIPGQYLHVFGYDGASPNLVFNPSFEFGTPETGPFPTDFAHWAGDRVNFVEQQNGISPPDGSRMLQFVYGGSAPGPYAGSQYVQNIDLSDYRTQIAAGTATLSASGLFNRVSGDGQTDTRFALRIQARSGTPSSYEDLRAWESELSSDGDVETWEEAAIVSIPLPADTDFVYLDVVAKENVYNDRTAPEFDGHYVDDLRVTLDASNAVVGNLVWSDLNANGIQDTGEPGVQGAVVELFADTDQTVGNADDRSLGTQITDVFGRYQFPDAPAYTNLYLQFRPPAGFTFTEASTGQDRTRDSDADSVGHSSMFMLTPGQQATDIDAGLVGVAPGFGYAVGTGSPDLDESADVAVDGSGNAYIIGRYQGNADFDPGPGMQTLTSAGEMDIFVAKYTRAGALVWANSLGGSGYDWGHGIAVGPDGNVYATGLFRETADFDPSDQTYNLTSEGGQDAFVVSLTPGGTLRWARAVGAASVQAGYDLAVSDAVYVTGEFAGTVDFDPGAGVFNLSSQDVQDVFVLKLDLAGNFVWARAMGGDQVDRAWSVAVENSGVCVAGLFESTADFDPGPGVYSLTSAGDADAFLVKLTGTGDFVWARRIGGQGGDEAYATAISGDGSVYVGGYFNGTADFVLDPDAFTLTSAGSDDAFVARFDEAGSLDWARRVGGSETDRILGLASDDYGRVYATGWFVRTVDFDPGEGTWNLKSAGNYDIFIAELDVSGDFVSARRIGGPDSDAGHSIALTQDGTSYIAGYFWGTADLDPSAGTFNLWSAGSRDVLLTKLLPSHAPMDIELSSQSIAEDQPANTTIGTFSSTDPDANETFIYELVPGEGDADNAAFAIEGDQLKTAAVFDYDTKNTYSIRVRSSEHSGLYTERQFTIDVLRVEGTVPVVISSLPDVTAGVLTTGVTELGLNFSEPVIGGGTAAHYQLQSLGEDALLGTDDDQIIQLGVSYAGTTATLQFAPLTAQVYRLSVRDIITDNTGNRLDGDADGHAGGDWVVDFVVIPGSDQLFSPAKTYATDGPNPKLVAMGDFNEDGRNDVAVSNWGSGHVGILLGKGDGSFETVTTFSSGGTYPYDLSAADFNGDGNIDLAVGDIDNGEVGILLGNGSGSFGPATSFESGRGSNGSGPWSLAVGDFNADGHSDLAVSHGYPEQDGVSPEGEIGILLGDGNGSFGPAKTYGTGGSFPRWTELEDLNDDGAIDLVVANERSGNVGILLGNGDGTFGEPSILDVGGAAPMTIGDFNSDGLPDLAVGVDQSVSVFWGNSQGVFDTTSTTSEMDRPPIWFAATDINADQNLDLAVITASADGGAVSGELAILIGDSSGSLTMSTSYGTGSSIPFAVEATDLNGDGRPDLVVTNTAGESIGTLVNTTLATAELRSAHQLLFDVAPTGFMAGQLLQGAANAFDGLNRLQVGTDNFSAPGAHAIEDGGHTLVTSNQIVAGLMVHREITVPDTGAEDFARTVDVFENTTGSPITTTVRIVGNLGSDTAGDVFATSDGDATIEATDQWIGTDDGDGVDTPAIIHYIHGPAGLLPTSVVRTGDNIEWTYDLTLPTGATLRLAHFTILAEHRADAVAAANALVASNGFGGEAAAFLTEDELQSLANFDFARRQIVSNETQSVSAPAGRTLPVPIGYTTSDNNSNLTGLGLRIHYDSSLMAFDTVTNVLETGLVSQQPAAADVDDYDGDPTTDKYVFVAWANLSGNWPSEPLPVQLLTCNFTLASGLAVGTETTVRFSASSTATGYGFESRPVTVLVEPTANLDIDDNGRVDALTDGILALRYLFDPNGSWSVADALGTGANRTSRSDIKTFLDQASATMLDADGNGVADALTDGILILRYLFDSGGAWAVSDALGAGAARTTRSAIKTFLDQYVPVVEGEGEAALRAAMTAEAESSQQQMIVASPSSLSAALEGSVSFDVTYTTDPLDPTLTGLGLRMHYDSSSLTFKNVSNIFSDSLLSQQPPVDDSADYDNDPTTDKYVLLGWADLGRLWPGTLPQRLFTAGFDLTEDAATRTQVNFTAGSSAAGWTFESSAATISVDGDIDGIADADEAGAPNSGDGNGDGVPDNEQAHVGSFSNAEDGQYVTLVAGEDLALLKVRAVSNPSPSNAPIQIQFPVAFVDFAVANSPQIASTEVTVFVETEAAVNTYYKYGPAPGAPLPHWYPFIFDGTTGAKIFADRIELYFVDGQRGDDDLQQNGIIEDVGAPGFTLHPWQNPEIQFDVDNDHVVAPLDVLVLINDINANGSRPLPLVPESGVLLSPYLDVSGDDSITPEDVLRVINHLNSQASGEGENAATSSGTVKTAFGFYRIKGLETETAFGVGSNLTMAGASPWIDAVTPARSDIRAGRTDFPSPLRYGNALRSQEPDDFWFGMDWSVPRLHELGLEPILRELALEMARTADNRR